MTGYGNFLHKEVFQPYKSAIHTNNIFSAIALLDQLNRLIRSARIPYIQFVCGLLYADSLISLHLEEDQDSFDNDGC